MEAGAKVILASHLGRPKPGKTRGALAGGRAGPAACSSRRLRGPTCPRTASATRPRRSSTTCAPARSASSRTSASTRRRRRTTRASRAARGALRRLRRRRVRRRAPRPRVGARAAADDARARRRLPHEEGAEGLSRLAERPEKPYVAVLGGAKVSDKIDVVEALLGVVDTLPSAAPWPTPSSRRRARTCRRAAIEEDKLPLARTILAKARRTAWSVRAARRRGRRRRASTRRAARR